MTIEDKNLLFKDLCARLAYGVKLQWFDEIVDLWSISIGHNKNLVSFKNKIDPYAHDEIYCGYQGCTITVAPECVKPYLRPMGSMTEEEKIEFSKLLERFSKDDWTGHLSTSYCIEVYTEFYDNGDYIKYPTAFSMEAIDWLNAHHFDFRGLIAKDLALEAPKGMYDL